MSQKCSITDPLVREGIYSPQRWAKVSLLGWSSRPNMETARSYVSSGDPHVVPHLDDFLRKIRRIWMQLSRAMKTP